MCARVGGLADFVSHKIRPWMRFYYALKSHAIRPCTRRSGRITQRTGGLGGGRGGGRGDGRGAAGRRDGGRGDGRGDGGRGGGQGGRLGTAVGAAVGGDGWGRRSGRRSGGRLGAAVGGDGGRGDGRGDGGRGGPVVGADVLGGPPPARVRPRQARPSRVACAGFHFGTVAAGGSQCIGVRRPRAKAARGLRPLVLGSSAGLWAAG